MPVSARSIGQNRATLAGEVCEAIRSLADSGLIDLIANRGAFVHETTLAELRNLYDNLVKKMHLFRRRGLLIATNMARSMTLAEQPDVTPDSAPRQPKDLPFDDKPTL